ncbi:MAG: UDP-2,3-diacylglucosamine diphosphatase LpxI [Rickettsiales bacterium]
MNNSCTLGIIAGKGNLPKQLIEHCRKTGRNFFVITFAEDFDNEEMTEIPHAVIKIGEVGKALELLREAKATEIVMVGGLKRPTLSSLIPDDGGKKLLKKLGQNFFKGDDTILKTIINFLEEENFKVIGIDSILPDIIAIEGVIGKISPNKKELDDIKIGMKAAKELGAKDIGQAVIIKNGKIVAEETEAGTDAMISHYTENNTNNKNNRGKKSGLLIKAKKPEQEQKADLPSIGINTVEKAHSAGLSGIAVEAGYSIIIDRKEAIKKANDYGIFIIGVNYE